MSALPDHKLRYMGETIVQPFRHENVQPASIDLCLGEEFIVFDAHEQVVIDLEYMDDETAKKVKRTRDEGFILHPGEFVLGVTEERVSIPENLMARLEGKSSVGRLGVMIHVTAGFIDPGFRGPITLEIANLRKIPIILRPGKTICQLSFFNMESPPSRLYNGRYQDAEGVEASKYGKDL